LIDEYFVNNATKFLNFMVAPQIFSAKNFFGVAGVKKFWGVSLENHFMHSLPSPDRPQQKNFLPAPQIT